jgi:hypothetical protein
MSECFYHHKTTHTESLSSWAKLMPCSALILVLRLMGCYGTFDKVQLHQQAQAQLCLNSEAAPRAKPSCSKAPTVQPGAAGEQWRVLCSTRMCTCQHSCAFEACNHDCWIVAHHSDQRDSQLVVVGSFHSSLGIVGLGQ